MKTNKQTKMEKSIKEIQQEFTSSSQKTKQYLDFHRLFKREFKQLLRAYCKDILIGKPNHFDINGFFKTNSDNIYYFSISDLRYSKDSMLIRTATDFKDYAGGSNNFIKLNCDFKENLLNYLKIGTLYR